MRFKGGIYFFNGSFTSDRLLFDFIDKIMVDKIFHKKDSIKNPMTHIIVKKNAQTSKL